MIVKKPSILIYTYRPDARVLKEVCAGMEEEGVFFEVSEQPAADPATMMAWRAALESMLGSGVGISGTACAFSMRGLAKDRCVEQYAEPDAVQSRKLGANSARAIKKLSFIE